MPFGIGLHVLVALVCAIHVVRSGQQMYWLFILFAFPLLGSLVYVFAVWLPSSRIERHALRVVGSATRALDPARAVREAQRALDETPTAQNQMRLASALLDAGRAEEAAGWYERSLEGPFASDPEMRLAAARALVESRQPGRALEHLSFIRDGNPRFREDVVSLLTARCLAAVGRSAEAKAEFESAVERFATFEARAEYAMWARSNGDTAVADRLDHEIDQVVARWNRHARELNAATYRRWKTARAG